MRTKTGFTLIELLISIAVVLILVGLIVFSLNPFQRLAEARNADRESDLNAIIGAVYQYKIDNGVGLNDLNIPVGIDCMGNPASEICSNEGLCDGLVDLSALVGKNRYLVKIPADPQSSSVKGIGYHIVQNSSGRVTICAPSAELGAQIEFTR